MITSEVQVNNTLFYRILMFQYVNVFEQSTFRTGHRVKSTCHQFVIFLWQVIDDQATFLPIKTHVYILAT